MKRFISALLAVLMVAALLPAGIYAAGTFSDIGSHWGKPYIEYMYGKNILNGYEDGTFRPDNQVTRAEFIKMLDETFGLTATTSISFSDVKSSDWFHVYISKAAAQGYLLSYGNSLNPNKAITREEAAALLVRYLDLPESNVVKSSEYPDYNSINSNYRQYVLQATYEGLFKGYEDSTFRPNNTLTRAEALTILYRAAGNIFDASRTGLDSAANSKNAVVTSSGVKISNANINGNVIISEGATGGSVTFDGCRITGNIYVRGSVKVVISNSTVNNMVTSAAEGFTSAVTVNSNSTIKSLTMKSASTVGLYTGATISSLVVEENAKKSSITGSGTLSDAVINAADFVSDQVPDKYTIKSGIKAKFNDYQYTGSSKDSTGFAKAPALTTASGYDKITGIPSYNGTLYYYYAASDAVPTSAQFNTSYNSAAKKTSLNLTAFTDIANSKFTVSEVGSFGYIVLMIKDSNGVEYKPVVLKREVSAATNGFSSNPVYSSVSGYDYITFTPQINGSLYYYYTNTPTPPSIDYYMTNYSTSPTKGEITGAVSGILKNQAVQYSTTTVSYAYIAVMYVDSNGVKYNPVIVAKSNQGQASAVASGFAAAPAISANGVSESVTFTPLYSGYLYYYYSTTSTAPSTASYMTYYTSSITNGLGGSILNLTANVPRSEITKPVSAVSAYPYIVFMLVDTNNVSYQPYVLSRTSSQTGTGFSTAPTCVSYGVSDMLSMTPMYAGKVYYYYTTASTAVNATTFWTNYNSSAYIKKSFVDVIQNTNRSIQTFTSAELASYPYVVVMLQGSNGTNYQPVVVSTPRASGTGSTGFSAAPTCSTYGTGDMITFTPMYGGRIYFYYTTASTAVNATTFWANYNSSAYVKKNYAEVIQNTSRSIQTFTSAELVSYPYVVVMLQGSNGTNYQPVVLSTPRTSGAGSTGFSATPTCSTYGTGDMITLTPMYSGKVYYYYTTASTAVNNTTFWANYNSGSYVKKNYVDVVQNTSRSFQTFTSAELTVYPYVVIMLQGSNGTNYQPVVLSTPRGSLSTTGFIGTPAITSSYSGYDTLTFKTSVNGTVYYYYSNNSTPPSAANYLTTAYFYTPGAVSGQYSATSGADITQNITAGYMSNYQYVVMMVMDYTGNKYTPVVVSRGLGQINQGTGFASTPYVSNNSLTFTPSYSGTLYYFYTNSNLMNINANTFQSNYNLAAYNMKGTYNVVAGYPQQLPLANSGNGTYIVISLLINNSQYCTPVTLPIYGGASATSSGFVSMPTVTLGYENGISYDMLNYNTVNPTGNILYYYTSAYENVNANTFTQRYLTPGTLTGIITLTGNLGTGKLAQRNQVSALYNYVVLQYTNGQQYSEPVIIAITR